MNTKKRKQIVPIIIILLLSTVFTLFSPGTLETARNVDILKVFACGLLAGILISTLRDLYVESRAGN